MNNLGTTTRLPWFAIFCPWAYFPPEHDPYELQVAAIASAPPFWQLPAPIQLHVGQFLTQAQFSELASVGILPNNGPVPTLIGLSDASLVFLISRHQLQTAQISQIDAARIAHIMLVGNVRVEDGISELTLNAIPTDSMNALIQHDLLTSQQIHSLSHISLSNISNLAFIHLISHNALGEDQYTSAYLSHDTDLSVIQARFRQALHGLHPNYGYVYPLIQAPGVISPQTLLQLCESEDSNGIFFFTTIFSHYSEPNMRSQDNYVRSFAEWSKSLLLNDWIRGGLFANTISIPVLQQFMDSLSEFPYPMSFISHLDNDHFSAISDSCLIKFFGFIKPNPFQTLTSNINPKKFMQGVDDLSGFARYRPAVLYEVYKNLDLDRKIIFVQLTNFDPTWTPQNHSGSSSSHNPPPPNGGEGRPGSSNDPAPDAGGGRGAGETRLLQSGTAPLQDLSKPLTPGGNYFGKEISPKLQDVLDEKVRLLPLDVVHSQLTGANQVHHYKIALTKGTIYHFYMVKEGDSHIDACIQLRNSAGELIASDNSTGGGYVQFISAAGGRNSSIMFIAKESGEYYLDARDDKSAGYSATGQYQLTAMVIERKHLEIGKSVSDVVDTPKDRDWYHIVLNKGETYNFAVVRANPDDGDGYRPLLCLRDAQGKSILLDETNTLGNFTNRASFNYSALESGDYFLDIGSAHSMTDGCYVLSTNRKDVLASVASGVVLTEGTSLRGTLENNSDHDWYKVDLKAGKAYRFILSHYNDTDHLDPYLYLRDSKGKEIKHDDDSARDLNSLIDFRPTQSGTYFLDAGSYRNSSHGEFVLAVI